MSKPLDKFTKLELIQMITALQAQAHGWQDKAATLNFDLNVARDEITALKADLKTLDDRRRFEQQTFRSKIRTQRASDAPPRRTDWSKLAQQYCTETGARSVSRADLEAYARTARES